MASRYRRFFRGTLEADHLADLIAILREHGHHAELHGNDIHSTTIPLYFSTDPLLDVNPSLLRKDKDIDLKQRPAYFIETGDDENLDSTIDAYFTELLLVQPDATSLCSHCYSHFTPVDKPFDPRESQSCTIGLYRSRPDLVELFSLPSEVYRAKFFASSDEANMNPDKLQQQYVTDQQGLVDEFPLRGN